MVISGWWVGEDPLWAELKYVFIMYGAQYVMMDGAEPMPMLPVDNWDTFLLVSPLWVGQKKYCSHPVFFIILGALPRYGALGLEQR